MVSAIPSRASSKQCLGSQWLVKMTTLWPRFCNPTAASMISLSAPPIPRSGWKNRTVSFFCASAILRCYGEEWEFSLVTDFELEVLRFAAKTEPRAKVSSSLHVTGSPMKATSQPCVVLANINILKIEFQRVQSPNCIIISRKV